MKPTSEQVAAAKAYFAAKKPTQQKRLTYLVSAECVRVTRSYAALAPRPDDFAPALASVLSAGLLGKVES